MPTNYNKLLAGLEGFTSADNTGVDIYKPDPVKKYTPLAGYQTPEIGVPTQRSLSTVQQKDAADQAAIDQANYRQSEDNAQQKATNAKILQGIGHFGDPLGTIAKDIWGDEESLVRTLFENFDIPLDLITSGGTKALAKGVMEGSIPLMFLKKQVLSAKEARKVMDDFWYSQKLTIPNAANSKQMVKAIHNIPRYGAANLNSFNPGDIRRLTGIENLDVAAEGSHRALLGEGLARASKKKGLDASPMIVTRDINADGPMRFSEYEGIDEGTGDKMSLLLDDNRRVVKDNKRGLELLTDPNNTSFILPSADLQDARGLSPSDLYDINKMNRDAVANISLQDILAGVEEVPVFEGVPDFNFYDDDAVANFRMLRSPYHSANKAANWNPEQGVFQGWDISLAPKSPHTYSRPTIREYWSNEIKDELGALDLKEAIDMSSDLSESASPVLRFIGDKVNSGELRRYVGRPGNTKPNPMFLENASDLLMEEYRGITQKAGTPDFLAYPQTPMIQQMNINRLNAKNDDYYNQLLQGRVPR